MYDKLQFGKEFTDHMLVINWSKHHGWSKPVIKKYEPFHIHPNAGVFQLGGQVWLKYFEFDLNTSFYEESKFETTGEIVDTFKAKKRLNDQLTTILNHWNNNQKHCMYL